MALMVSNTASPALMIMSYSLRPYSLEVLRSTSFISARVRIGIIRSPVQIGKVTWMSRGGKGRDVGQGEVGHGGAGATGAFQPAIRYSRCLRGFRRFRPELPVRICWGGDVRR